MFGEAVLTTTIPEFTVTHMERFPTNSRIKYVLHKQTTYIVM